jgi:integrase
MACIRKRRGKYVVDFRDAGGARRWVTCDTKSRANTVLSEKLRGIGVASESSITLREYGEQWLNRMAVRVKPRTWDSYRDNLKRHVFPALANIKLQKLRRSAIKDFLSAKLQGALRGNTVRIINSALRACLSEAVEDGIILSNPAAGLGRRLVLKGGRDEEVKAMDGEQLASFLAKTMSDVKHYYPLFLTLARTGLRLGEAAAIEIGDVDLDRGIIRVNKSYDFKHKTTASTKTGEGREVDVSDQLAGALRLVVATRREELFQSPGRPLLFVSPEGEALHAENTRRAFRRALGKAKLPLHFSPHCMRHSFASLLLQQGESIAYVRRMLGHSSVRLTVDLYGRWLPAGNRAAVNRLDDIEAKKV